MQQVAGLLLGYSELLGLTRNYSDLLEPSKTACRNGYRGVYLRFYRIAAQDGPIAALTYSELLGLTLTRSAPQARESRRALQAPDFSEIRTAIHRESEDIASAPERMTSLSILIPSLSSTCFLK